MDTDNINIKQEKSDDSYDIVVNNKAKALPKPIAEVKQEQNENHDLNDNNSNNARNSDDNSNTTRIKEEKQNEVHTLSEVPASSENNYERHNEDSRGITPPRPIIIQKQSPNHDSDSDQNMVDDLTFLDDLNDNLDDIIPIVNEIPIINLDEDVEPDVYKDMKINEEAVRKTIKKEKSDEGETKRKKEKKKKKNKKKRSRSPVDVKPNLKRLNESLGLLNQLSDISEDETFNSNEKDNENRLPRKVYNYNHSSVPTVLENIENEKIQSTTTSSSVIVKEERQDISNNEQSKIIARPPLPKKIKLEQETVTENKDYANENNIDQVLKTCKKALKHLKLFKSKQNFHRFLYTPTKIIVPISDEEKEYRSPLLRSSQVSFKYSSTNPNIQYNEFNLECLSEKITHVSKPLGLDVSKLKDWIQNFSTNSYIKAKNKECNKKPFESDNEIINLTTIHTSVSTQTIDIPCDVCLLRELRLNNHVGVMAKMEGNEISTQTEEKQNELPILRVLESLNANQLLALNDFTMLLREQNWDSADASSRLLIRDKILQYFQEGQKPCNVPGIRKSTQSSNTHNRSMTNPSYRASTNSSNSIPPVNAMYSNNSNPMYNNLTPVPQASTNSSNSILPINAMYSNNSNPMYNNLTSVPQASTNGSNSILPVNAMYSGNSNPMYNNLTSLPPQMAQYQYKVQPYSQGVMENYGAVIQHPVNHRNPDNPGESRTNDPRINRMDPRYRH